MKPKAVRCGKTETKLFCCGSSSLYKKDAKLTSCLFNLGGSAVMPEFNLASADIFEINLVK